MVYEVMCDGCYESITCLHFDLMVALLQSNLLRGHGGSLYVYLERFLTCDFACHWNCAARVLTRDLDGAWLIAERAFSSLVLRYDVFCE